jgi:hypothetical protein
MIVNQLVKLGWSLIIVSSPYLIVILFIYNLYFNSINFLKIMRYKYPNV